MAVVAAATLVIAPWAAAGLVNPGMVNVIALPPENTPAVNEMVKIKGPVPVSAAVPAGTPGAGAVNVRAPAPVSAKPALPVSVMRSLPLLATVDAGVSVMLIVTAEAPFATLRKVIAGDVAPRRSTMAG